MIIDRIVILTAILLFPALVLSLVRIFKTGWLNLYLIQISLYVLVAIITLFREKIKAAVKISVVFFIYVVVAYTGLINLSIGGAYFYIILAVALLPILGTRKTTLIFTVLFLITYCIIAYGFVSGYLIPKVDLNLLSKMPSHWIAHFIALFSLCLIFIYGFGDFYNELRITLESKDATEKKYRLLFEKANDAITLLKDGKFFDSNEKACEFYMMERNEIIGKSVQEVSPKFQFDGQWSGKKPYHYVQKTLQGHSQQFEW